MPNVRKTARLIIQRFVFDLTDIMTMIIQFLGTVRSGNRKPVLESGKGGDY